VLAFILVIVSWQVPDRKPVEHQHERVSVSRRLREPRVLWFLLSAALMVFAHGALYAYLSIYLAELGYSKTAIGVFWVLSVLLEIAFFVTQGRWFRRFGVYSLLVASFIVAAVRFLLIAELATVWWVLAFAQLLHAVTFAVHHSASVLTIQRWFPGQAAAREAV
jgi:PPP family 3-phenylpropionic acid transporter